MLWPCKGTFLTDTHEAEQTLQAETQIVQVGLFLAPWKQDILLPLLEGCQAVLLPVQGVTWTLHISGSLQSLSTQNSAREHALLWLFHGGSLLLLPSPQLSGAILYGGSGGSLTHSHPLSGKPTFSHLHLMGHFVPKLIGDKVLKDKTPPEHLSLCPVLFFPDKFPEKRYFTWLSW